MFSLTRRNYELITNCDKFEHQALLRGVEIMITGMVSGWNIGRLHFGGLLRVVERLLVFYEITEKISKLV